MADHKASEADHIQIVVLDALTRRKGLMNQAGPNPRHFVRGDRCSDTASTDGYATIHFSTSDGTGQRYDKIGIVIVDFGGSSPKSITS